jgi:hypothetical protein
VDSGEYSAESIKRKRGKGAGSRGSGAELSSLAAFFVFETGADCDKWCVHMIGQFIVIDEHHLFNYYVSKGGTS